MNKVYVSSCKEYDYDLIYNKIKEGIDALGGIEKFIKPGESVFIKANLLMAKAPKEAVTTHPVFIKALGNYLIHENDNNVIVGDSPGGPFNEKALSRVYRTCGYIEAFKNTEIKLNHNFEIVKNSFLNGKLLKNITLIKGATDCDKIISVAKLKTHGMMKYTGAVKNMFGMIPGVLKAEFHFRMPEVKDFADMLIDVCEASSPVLSFIDGIQGMEGSGPSNGDIVDSQVLFVSDNPYVADRVASEVIGMDYETVPTVIQSIKRDLAPEKIEEEMILGEGISHLNVKKFITPNISKIDFISRFLPEFLATRINNRIKPKPVFNHDKCIKCRACYDNCPAKTIKWTKNNYPELILDDCISCFCCQELCPVDAVIIKRPWILDKFLNG